MGSLYGYEVETDLPLQRLNAARGTRGSLTVASTRQRLFDPAAELAHRLDTPDGRLWFATAEIDDDCILHLPPTATFLLEPSASRILVEPGDDDVDGLFEHRLASSAVCTLLAMRGDLMLHASAVEHDGWAVVFCGTTGRGKSTLARALGESGLPVLAEDGIAISLDDDLAVTFPGARGVRIRRPDGANGIRTDLIPDPGPVEPPPVPAGAIVALRERGDGLEIERADPAKMLAMLTAQLIHTGGRDSLAAAFARLARLLRTVPAFTAKLPDDLEALPGAATQLLDRIDRRR